jgi:hypothetical protein
MSLIYLTLISQNNNHHKTYIEIGIVGGVQNTSSSIMGVYGCIGTNFNAFGKPSSLDVRVKENYITNPQQQATIITLTYRTGIVKGLFAGIGGAHAHQIIFNEFLVHPTSSIGGTNSHILHSTGLNAELGYNFNSFIKDKYIGIYPNVLISYTQLFASGQAIPNITLSAGLKIGLKKWN